jgi:hypothetical protein
MELPGLCPGDKRRVGATEGCPSGETMAVKPWVWVAPGLGRAHAAPIRTR